MLLFSRLLFLTSAPRPARARCGAIREETLPPCSPPLLPLPGPALPLVCSFSLVLPCPPSQAPGPLSPCPRPPFTPPAYTSRSNTRGIPPTPSSPCRPLVPWSPGLWHARRTAPACGLCPSTPALPPPPSAALFPLGHYAGHCAGMSHACRRHAPGLYRRRRRAGWHHAAAARRCHSPRRSRRRRQPLHTPRGARPW